MLRKLRKFSRQHISKQSAIINWGINYSWLGIWVMVKIEARTFWRVSCYLKSVQKCFKSHYSGKVLCYFVATALRIPNDSCIPCIWWHERRMKEAQNIWREGERVIFHLALHISYNFVISGKHVVCSPSNIPKIYIYWVPKLVTDLKPGNNGYNRVYQKYFFIYKNFL